MASSPNTSCHLARAWNSSESSVRSPGKPTASSSAETCRAQSDGAFSANRSCCGRAANSFSSRPRSSGAPSTFAISFGRLTVASSFLRSFTSSFARAASSVSASPMKGERMSWLAFSNEISSPENSRMDKASATTGYRSNGKPSETLNGIGAFAAPGRLNPGCMTREKTRTTSLRRCCRSGTTTPMREEIGVRARFPLSTLSPWEIGL